MPDLKGRKAVAVACGLMHIAILLDDGQPVIFGGNDSGQTDVPDIGMRKAVTVACLGEI